MTDLRVVDLLVVGAGPAGRALAHRALVHGAAVTVVDPEPDRVWTATIGLFLDDLPHWLRADEVIACAAEEFVVYTPQRRAIPRPYGVLSTAALQRRLDVAGARVVAQRITEITARTVRLDDGRLLAATHVIDARGAAGAGAALPRQRAYGVTVPSESAPEMVLMDWSRSPASSPSFSYRVDLGDGERLVEETCLAGAPPPSVDELARRNGERLTTPDGSTPDGTRTELVDFPLYLDGAPWRIRGDEALRFGAAGGLMHPATGYSIAASLGAADPLARALCRGDDPAHALWPASARWTHRLRMLGLSVLLGFDGPELTVFFDTFFALPMSRQRAYLGDRCSLRDTAGAMWAVMRALPAPLRRRLLRQSLRAIYSPA